MIGGLWDDDNLRDEQITELLSALLGELSSADAPRRREILEAICDLCRKSGSRAAAAIPALIGWPHCDTETEDAVCYALRYCAPASIIPLLELLGHPSALVRQRACRTLGLIGKDIGEHLIPAANGLLSRLEDASEDVRGKAAFALGRLGDRREATVARLLDVARSKSASNRAAALHAIGSIGRKQTGENLRHEDPPIALAAEIVLTALDDIDAQVRRSACYALEALGLPPDQHLERIIRILEHDPSAEVQAWAASQLPRLAERSEISGAAARLARFLGRDHQIAMPVCEALGKIGSRAQAAVPSLLEALESEDDRIALEAAEALWLIERRANLVLPTLDRLFDEANGEKICDIVCLLGPAARPLLPKLFNALAQDDYWDLQWAAADAIGHISSTDPETLQALKTALAHESGKVRSAAATAFARIGEPAVPLLLDMLSTDLDEKRQEWVAEAFSRMGPTALAAVPSLRSKLQSRHRDLRLWAAIALAKIASDPEAVPALIEILEDVELAEMWPLACESLAQIGAPAQASRERLDALTACPVEEIKKAAELAISAIDRQSN